MNIIKLCPSIPLLLFVLALTTLRTIAQTYPNTTFSNEISQDNINANYSNANFLLSNNSRTKNKLTSAPSSLNQANASNNHTTLYSKAFGDSENKPIIFLHGGPSSSSVYFEATTAQKLADLGFYVIIYDRRGEGRSADTNAKINYKEAFNDLNNIYEKYNLQKATLMGFSFGGLVTTLYAEANIEKVESIILISSLISQQESYTTIFESLKSIYRSKKDYTTLENISVIEKLDKNSIEYRNQCFSYAFENGFFRLKNPNNLADSIYSTYSQDILIKNYVKNKNAVETFWKNEKRKNIDVHSNLSQLKEGGIEIYALYGMQDGLYSKKQVKRLRKIIGRSSIKYFDNCSHSLFIDQQTSFLNSVKKWIY